jgi:hypothetical protein
MESEQSQNFNERLSQWVANQGFWFQVRYSISGSGTTGTAMFHLLRMSVRLLIFLLIASAGYWVYLVKRPNSEGFREDFQLALDQGLSATESEMRGLTVERGQFAINRLASTGGSGTFFSSFEARNIRGKIGLFHGKGSRWDPGTISISTLDLDLNAGADDAESAESISSVVFAEFPNAAITNFEVADASLRWGYSDRARGSISNSVMKIQRGEGTLRVSFQGGTFSQNWLRDLEIVNLVVRCNPQGLVFEQAKFQSRRGTVDFSGLTVTGGERPVVDGMAQIRMLDFENILPVPLRSFVEGSISGDFKVSGSTNTSEGVGFEGQVTLDGQDVIMLRDRVHLLKALSVVDYVRNYHRADFRSGSFYIKSGGGGLVLSDLNLRADDLLTLEGGMLVRLPTAEETRIALQQGSGNTITPLFGGDEVEPEMREAKDEDPGFTLRRAAIEDRRAREGRSARSGGSGFDDLASSLEMRRLEERASERLSRTLRYEGAFKITLQGDAFDRATRLARQFPVDPTSRRIPMMVPIEGTLYELTLKQAEDLYQQGAR